MSGGRELSFEVNKLCNFRCSFCYTDKQRETLPALERVFAIIDEGIAEGVAAISLTGGEPLLQAERVIAIAGHARSRGLRVRLNTNAYLMPEAVRASLLEVVDEFQVSFNAADNATFAGYSGLPLSAAPFDKVLANAAALKAGGGELTIRFTLDHDTVSNLLDVYSLFSDGSAAFAGLRADRFKLRVSVPAGQVRNQLFDCEDSMKVIDEFFRRVARNPSVPVIVKDGTGTLGARADIGHVSSPACLCGPNSIHISCDLKRVTPCVFLRDDPAFAMGELSTGATPLKTIWKSRRVVEFSRHIENGAPCPSHAEIAAAASAVA